MNRSRILKHPATYLVLASVLLLSHALFYASLLGFDAVDDAYISFRYAYNAARGYGLTFNVGERRVEGYTNFLWTVMLIPVFWLKLPVHTVSIVLGAFWALGSVALLGRMTWNMSGSERWLGSLAALLLAADGSFALWVVGGLESPLFAFLVLGGGLAYLREWQKPDTVPLSGVWFALAAMTRPEGLLVYGVTGLHQIATRLIRERTLVTGQDWRRLGLFVLVWAPWFAFRWRYYGFPLPNTFYAKVAVGFGPSAGDSSAQRARGLDYMQTFVRIHLGYVPLAVALLPLLPRHMQHRRWRMWGRRHEDQTSKVVRTSSPETLEVYFRNSYFVSVILVYGAYIAYVGGDWSVGRFFVPLMPMFYALLGGGLIIAREWLGGRVTGWLGGWVERGVRGRLVVGLVVVGLMVGLFIQSSLNGEKALFLDPFDARLAGRARTAMGKWLRDNVPRDTFIAVDAAGQMPFYADLRALDVYGLTDLNIAHRKVESLGEGTPGHEKMDMDYVIFVAQPDYIIIYGTAFDWLSAFSYERVNLPWTDDPELEAFLGVYERQ